MATAKEAPLSRSRQVQLGSTIRLDTTTVLHPVDVGELQKTRATRGLFNASCYMGSTIGGTPQTNWLVSCWYPVKIIHKSLLLGTSWKFGFVSKGI